jgi:hypothetical protein
MSDLAPELGDEIKRHLRDMSCRDGMLSREGMIIRDMERGLLTVEEIAASQRASVDNIGRYVRGTEEMLRGELPKSPSGALKASGGYRYLLGCELSPALRSHVTSFLRQLKAINPNVRVDEPFRPGPPRNARNLVRDAALTEETACPNCHTIHAGECF